MISHIGEKLFYGQEPVYSSIYAGNLFDIDVDIKSNNTIGLLLPHGEGMAACNDNKQNGLLRLS